MSIKKRNRKTKTVYQVRVQVEGRRKSKVFRKYQDAKTWQENIQLDGRVIDYANITFAQAAQMWIESNAGIYQAFATLKRNKQMIEHLLPLFGDTRLDKVTPESILKFIRDKQEANKSAHVVNNYLKLMRTHI